MKVKRIIVLLIFVFSCFCAMYSQEEVVETEQVEEEKKDEELTLEELILSEKNEEEICKEILTKKYSKKSLNQVFADGYSPLLLAIHNNKIEVFKTLISKGANVNQVSSFVLRDDKSERKFLRCNPFLYAAWKGNLDCLQILLENKAETNVEADLIIPAEYSTYIRLILPIDAAFYNRKNIDFNAVHKLIQSTVDYEHTHFSGKIWAYGKVKTEDLLKEYNVFEIK